MISAFAVYEKCLTPWLSLLFIFLLISELYSTLCTPNKNIKQRTFWNIFLFFFSENWIDSSCKTSPEECYSHDLSGVPFTWTVQLCFLWKVWKIFWNVSRLQRSRMKLLLFILWLKTLIKLALPELKTQTYGVVQPDVVHQYFQTSPQILLSQLKPDFIWGFHVFGVWSFVQKVLVKMVLSHIWWKTNWK